MAKVARATRLLPLRWPAVSGALGHILKEPTHSRHFLAAVSAGQDHGFQGMTSNTRRHEDWSASEAATWHEPSGHNEPWWRRASCLCVSHSRPKSTADSSFLPPASERVQFDATASFPLLIRQLSSASLQGKEEGCMKGRGSVARANVRSCSSDSSGSGVPKRRKSRPYQAAAAAELKGQEGKLFAVLLDGKELLTPARDPVQVPSLPLAYAIAAEWEWQEGLKLRPYTMPLMKLAATSIDQMPKDRDRVIASLLEFFHTDQVLIRHPEPSAGPEPIVSGASVWGPSGVDAILGPSFHQQQHRLCERQRELLDPLLELLRSEFGIEAVTSSDYIPPPQSVVAITFLEQALISLDNWHLAAVDSLANATRSVTIGLLLSRGLISLEAAMAAARLEEDFQIESAGFVEGGHDIDTADLKVKLLAPTVFIRLLNM